MSQRANLTIIATTDGTRPDDVDRLLLSLARVPNLQLVMVLQNGCAAPTPPAGFKPLLHPLHVQERLSISEARNRALDAIEASAAMRSHALKGYLLLADDDCWYADECFDGLSFEPSIQVFRTVDPGSGRCFTTLDLSRRWNGRPMARWELMFYTVSITLAVPYPMCVGQRFHPQFGLGAVVCAGEETIFVLQLCRQFPSAGIASHPQRLVFHPWKLSNNADKHRDLAYFLGWCLRQGFASVFPYYAYMVLKYGLASVLRTGPLYRSIALALLSEFWRGVFNTRRIADGQASGEQDLRA